MSLVLLGAVLAPAVLALAVALRTPLRRPALALAPWAALPALLVALRPGPGGPVDLPWLLLGARVGLDTTGQVFLLFTALLWLLAGVYARAYLAHDPARTRFFAFFLLTMSGNLALVAAHDVVSFYTAFTVMTFAAYPLIVHRGDAEARRAGRVYVVMAVIGETLLLAGFLPAVWAAGSLEVGAVAAGVAASPWRGVVVGLLLAGFGVKAGALPLHVWLPLAHPVAPTPASAVLSGCMIEAGLLGWLRFLPLGEATLPGWGALVIGLGLAAAFFGVLAGVTQRDPKTALAYSSISQMGIVNVAVGIGLANPAAWPPALAACLVYVTHHGLAKGALFLGVGVAEAAAGRHAARRTVLAGLGFAALALAGAPLTSGMVAKTYLKDSAATASAPWPGALDALLPLTAVGTTLLMGRFLMLVARRTEPDPRHPLTPGLWLPWAVLLAAVASVTWALPYRYPLGLEPPGLPYPGAVWAAVWPLAAGLLLLWTAIWLARRRPPLNERLHVAAGDLLIPAEAALARVRERWPIDLAREPPNPVAAISSQWYGVYARSDRESRVVLAERRLTRWTSATVAALVLGVALFVLLAAG